MDQHPFHWRCGLYVGSQSHSFLEWAHATYSLPLCCNIQDSLWWGLIWVRSYPPLDCPGCLITNHSGFHSYICFWHLGIFFFFFFKKSITYFNQRLITLQNCSGFLPYIDMNQPCVYMCRPSWTPLPPPSPSLTQSRPSAPALSTLSRASYLDWRSASHTIIYIQCCSLKSSRPRLLPQSPKDCSINLCLFCCLTCRIIVTIFLNSIYVR